MRQMSHRNVTLQKLAIFAHANMIHKLVNVYS